VEKHALEDATIDAVTLENIQNQLPTLTSDDDLNKFARCLESFIDDFCAMAQTLNEEALHHLSSAILTSIHEVFPSPSKTGQAPQEDPISITKLLKGEGVWILDGIKRCIELPPDKVARLVTELKAVGRATRLDVKRLETLQGWLWHVAIGIPGG